MKIGRQGEGGGQKRKFESVRVLDDKINAYFEYAKNRVEIPNISALALYLGFFSSKSLYEYEQTPKYGNSIKKARLTIESIIENRLLSGKPPIGLIFALKNRFGWQDKQELDMTSNGQTLGVIEMPVK